MALVGFCVLSSHLHIQIVNSRNKQQLTRQADDLSSPTIQIICTLRAINRHLMTYWIKFSKLQKLAKKKLSACN